MDKKRKTWLSVVGALSAAALLIYLWSQGWTIENGSFLRDELAKTIAAPDKIEVYRVSLEPTDGKEISGFSIIGTSPVQNADFDAQVSSALLKIYRQRSKSNLRPDCTFEPAVAFRFIRAGQEVDALACFACGEMGIIHHESSRYFMIPFYNHRDEVIGLAKKAFPDDIIIGEL